MAHSVLGTEGTTVNKTDIELVARSSHASFHSRIERQRRQERKKLIQKLLGAYDSTN